MGGESSRAGPWAPGLIYLDRRAPCNPAPCDLTCDESDTGVGQPLSPQAGPVYLTRMLFWIITGLTALIVAAGVVRPMLRPESAPTGPAPDQALYRAQLAEIDRDLARGVLDRAEADRTRAEVARRLISADRQAPAPLRAMTGRVRQGLALLAGGGAVVGTLVLYATLGAPGFPDMPRAARLAAAQDRFDNRLTQAEAEARAAAQIAAQQITPPDDIQASVASVQADLADDPANPAILTLLRDFAIGTRDWPQAAALQGRLNGLDTPAPDDLALQIDLMVFATNGYLSADAKPLLERLATQAPGHPALPWFEGLVYADVGRPDLAFAVWRPLAEEGTGAFADRARSVIAQTAADAGIPYDAPAAIPADQQEAIVGMVAGLANRLATEGGPASDWARLIRSYGVLGQTDQAAAIWAEAQVVFADDAPGLAELRTAAEGAGVAE